MGFRERINPKTGKKEYKYRYYYIRDEKKRDSETAWFNSKEKAQEEGEKLKALKEKMERDKTIQRRDKMLISAFEEFIEYMGELSATNESTTIKKRYKTAKVMYNKHFPLNIQKIQMKDIDRFTFRKWLSILNSKSSIGGNYIRDLQIILSDFNRWLANNGYYIDGDFMEEDIAITLMRTKLKSKEENNRELKGERNVITILGIERITRYYALKGLGEFRNFYFYTMFFVLFFSGIRVEELIGLQWKNIDLRENMRKIYILNAIPRLEDREHAHKRASEVDYKTKTKQSKRIIPIFDFYYDLLVDYKESYKYQYGLSNDELEEGFVFPSLISKSPYVCGVADTIWKEFKKTIRVLGEKNTDLQMFRHSCATFLILPPPNGLGFKEENVKDYFGHMDTQMLNKVYATINMYEKSDRMSELFKGIYNPTTTDEKELEEQMKMQMINRIYGKNDRESSKARKIRIYKQIDIVIKNGRDKYFYKEKDKEIIEEYINEHNPKIQFIMD